MPSEMDKNGRKWYPTAISDAVQHFSGSLGRKFQDVSGPFWWDIAHSSPRVHFAHDTGGDVDIN